MFPQLLRRIYFVIPDLPHTQAIVEELEEAHVSREQLHVVGDGDLHGLPAATKAQQNDRVWLLERLFWSADLILFSIAVIGLVVAATAASMGGASLAIGVMMATFALGNQFATHMPHTHLGDLLNPLTHGEAILMVDVPKQRVDEIEHLVAQHHTEAQIGGVGWAVKSLDV